MENFTGTLISALIAILGIIVSLYLNKLNIKSQLKNHFIKDFIDNYKNIEYDIAEILQLTIRDYLGDKEYNKLDYVIQKNRTGNFLATSDLNERIYRLGGYVSTYGSKDTIVLLNIVKKHYKNHKHSEENFYEAILLLAKLLMHIKQDTFFYYKYKKDDRLDWLCTRLPVELYNRFIVYYNKNNLK